MMMIPVTEHEMHEVDVTGGASGDAIAANDSDVTAEDDASGDAVVTGSARPAVAIVQLHD